MLNQLKKLDMWNSEEFWREWWSNRTPSVNFNVINTDQYNIIEGKPVERTEYKRKRLETEKENLESIVKAYEKMLIEKSKRMEEIDKELKDL